MHPIVSLTRRIVSGVVALLFVSIAFAHDWRVGDVRIVHPIALATVPAQKTGAVYLTLENGGKQSVKLVSASSPVAARAELHSMTMTDNNVMRMREAEAIELKPGETVKMRPGDGYHIMLVNLVKPLTVGDKFPLTLQFSDGGKTEVTVWVQRARGASKGDEHKH